jgi:hypothetical protein
MNNQENDRDPNAVSNQDMREFKSSEKGIEDSGGSLEPDIEPTETEDDTSETRNKTSDSESTS